MFAHSMAQYRTSCHTDDQGISRGVDHLSGYGLQAIDRDDTGDLRQQPLEQAEISSRYAENRGQYLFIRQAVGRQGHPAGRQWSCNN